MSRRLIATLAGLSALGACGGGGTVTDGRTVVAQGLIGPDGGALTVVQGPGSGFRLDVPAGALAASTWVRILVFPIDPLAAVVSMQIAIEPEAVELLAPVQITMPCWGGMQAPLATLLGCVTTRRFGRQQWPARSLMLNPVRVVFEATCFGTVWVERDPPTADLRDYLLPMQIIAGQFEDGLRCGWQEHVGPLTPEDRGFLTIFHAASGTDETLELRWGVEELQLWSASNPSHNLDVLEHAIPWAPVAPEVGVVSGSASIAGFAAGVPEPLYRGTVAHSTSLQFDDPMATPAGLFADVLRLQTATVWIRGAEVTEQARRIWLAREEGVVAMQFGDGPVLRLLHPRQPRAPR